MPLIDLLRPDQRAALRRLRKKIGNRENMRRYRAEHRDKMLCAGVDLPLEAGTCGRLVWPESERCIACRKRRRLAPPPRAQLRRAHAGRAAR